MKTNLFKSLLVATMAIGAMGGGELCICSSIIIPYN